MIGHRCHRCLWWDNEHISIGFISKIEWKPKPGFCRRRKAGAILIEQNHVGIHPIMDANEFCGEFKKEV